MRSLALVLLLPNGANRADGRYIDLFHLYRSTVIVVRMLSYTFRYVSSVFQTSELRVDDRLDMCNTCFTLTIELSTLQRFIVNLSFRTGEDAAH